MVTFILAAGFTLLRHGSHHWLLTPPPFQTTFFLPCLHSSEEKNQTFAARVGNKTVLGNEICVEGAGAFCRKALACPGNIDEAGTILSLLLPFPVFTMGFMLKAALGGQEGEAKTIRTQST